MTDDTRKYALRSPTVHQGTIRASARAFLHALGQDDDDIARPHIGVFHTGGEMSPCNLNLQDQAQHAKMGIYAGGGTPHECPVVSVSDGLTMAHSGMRFSLISRELIADSVEASVRGHQWDGIFGIGACDKNLPGLMMAMVRCNVPSVFVHGGSAMPGRMPGAHGADLNIVDTYETLGRLLAGEATREQLDIVTRACLPTAGACAGQFTANTMGMVSEALGLAPIGSSMVPAVYSERAPLLRRAGKALMQAVPHFDMPQNERLRPLVPVKVDSSRLGAPAAARHDGPLLQVEGLTKSFTPREGGGFLTAAKPVRVVEDVGFSIPRGQTLGLVGESGSGKTTVGKMIVRAITPDSGRILLDGEDVLAATGAKRMEMQRRVQMVFQDPVSSLSPHMTVGSILTEPLEVHEVGDRASRKQVARDLMRAVGLPERDLARYPHSFSGGQRQRIGIARALALGPELIVCDEATSALDV